MAPEAERHAAPSSASASDGEPPKPDAAPNLFAPVSTANRITGQTHGRRQHAQQQLTPGSAYDYGRSEYFKPVWSDPLPRAEDALGYQKSMPATFLKRTLTEPAPAAAEAPGWFSPQVAAYPGIPLPAQSAANAGAQGMGFTAQPAAPVAFSAPAAPDVRADPAGARPVAFSAPAQGIAPAPAMPSAPAVPQSPTLPEGLAFSTDVARPAVVEPPAPETPAPWPLAPSATAAPVAPRGYGMPAPTTFAPVPDVVYAAPQQPYGVYAAPEPPAQPLAPATAPAPEAVWAVAPDLHPGDAYGLYPPPVAAQAAPARHRRAERNRAQEAYPTFPMPDTWADMGWKSPEPAPMDTTMVWRASDLNMFERDAFAEPLNPFSDPAAFAQAGYPPAEPEAAPYPGWGPAAPWDGEPPAPQDEPAPYPEVEGSAVVGGVANPYAYGAPYGLPAEPMPPAHTKLSERAPRIRTLSAVSPWRLALWVGCALVLLFCGIEVFKIVQSLVSNEQSLSNYRQEYYRLTGQDPADSANGVELLPAGQTYTPTATPQPVVTSTPEPRIAQNDPLIGVVDAGGASAAPALPSQTPVTRTRLTKYPDNPLLSVDEAFTELRKENPDVVGRLTIDGLLDETIVQRNNTFYLTHNARGLHGTQGAVFVDEGCSLQKPPENLLLRAQTQPEGKLFAPLTRYGQEGAAFIRAHGIVRCDTIYEKGVYVVFAVVQADSDVNSPAYFNYAGYPTFQSDTQMLGYVKAARNHSVCAIDVGVRADDRLLTLATVGEGNETKNWVIFCRRLRSGESETHIQRD
ncbi:MAG: hypothetical protein VB104_10715 [Candidatus Limiplasma sp.]|nr:hypothetical protein [Candidatus Limiplasma sp.]